MIWQEAAGRKWLALPYLPHALSGAPFVAASGWVLSVQLTHMHPTSLDASFDKLLTVPFLLLLAGLGVLCLSAPLRVLAGKKGAVYVVTDRRVLLLFDGWDDRLDQGGFLEFEPSDFEVGRVFHHRDDTTSIRLKRQADWFSRRTCYPLGLYGVKDGAGSINAIGKLMQLCWKTVW